MSAWIPAGSASGSAAGSAPESPDGDLPGEEPVVAAAKGSRFLITNGHGGGSARDGGWATRIERGCMVGADATGGGGTRADMRGRRFSFPLDLLLLSADFFHVNAGISSLLASLGEVLSTREKALAKAVDTDAGRLDGCRAGVGAADPAATIGVSWY